MKITLIVQKSNGGATNSAAELKACQVSQFHADRQASGNGRTVQRPRKSSVGPECLRKMSGGIEPYYAFIGLHTDVGPPAVEFWKLSYARKAETFDAPSVTPCRKADVKEINWGKTTAVAWAMKWQPRYMEHWNEGKLGRVGPLSQWPGTILTPGDR